MYAQNDSKTLYIVFIFVCEKCIFMGSFIEQELWNVSEGVGNSNM